MPSQAELHELTRMQIQIKQDRRAYDDLYHKCYVASDPEAEGTFSQLAYDLAKASEILANLAGTVESLALNLASVTDRVTVLERVVDLGPLPVAIDPTEKPSDPPFRKVY